MTDAALPRLLLASTSPRRRELLTQAGITFHLIRPGAGGVDETPLPGEDPADYVDRLARAKARAGHAEALLWGHQPPVLVLGADTTVAVDDEILGKPVDAADARRMLKLLSGRAHRVLTGICLDDGEAQHALVSVSNVTFRALTPAHIEDYVASGEPFDKAGAYGIQGRAACLVKHLEGSYSGIMGLPLCELAELLEHWQQRRSHSP